MSKIIISIAIWVFCFVSLISAEEGLVLSYTFDEGTGTTVYDSSGNSNTGTINGTVTWVKGKYGSALEYNGTNTYVNAEIPDITDAITIEAWVKINNNYFLGKQWGGNLKDSGYIQRSTDQGKRWGKPVYFLPPKEYRCWPSRIRQLQDGRLVLMAGVWKQGDGGDGRDFHTFLKRMTKMMFLSSDKGQTWSKPIVLMPTEMGVCEESDFCELPNGDLFWMHRCEHYPDTRTEISPLAERMGPNPPESFCYTDRMQSITRKKGDTFVPETPTPAPFRHSGSPMLLYTQEGLILHIATTGIDWSADIGKTWTRLDIPGTAYYPKALQLKNGKIICIGHIGSDDAYGTVDQAIRQQTFRLSVTQTQPAGVKVEDYSEKIIYHSPERPGYTAWVRIWQMPDGKLQCAFTQVTGPRENPVISAPVMKSSDNGETWKLVSNAPVTPNKFVNDRPAVCNPLTGVDILKDGTVVRAGWPVQPVDDIAFALNSTAWGIYHNGTFIWANHNTLADGNWHHFAATYDKSLDSGNMKSYLDGNLSGTPVTYTKGLPSYPANLFIGSDYGESPGVGPNRFISGIIDEVKIYNRALTASEISTHYNRPQNTDLHIP